MPHDLSPHDSVAEALEQLGRMSLRDQSMETVLQKVVDLAASVLLGGLQASISLLVDDRPTTAVFSGALALALDESQYERGYGPCLHAARTGELTEISDARTDTRWPDYARVAWERGSGSSLSVPLPIQEPVNGALNLYAREARSFDDEARSAAQRFSPYAGVAVSNMHAYQSARDMATNLQIALESRAVIDQAKGILMERHRLTADEAFQALASVSMRTNTKVREVAEQLVLTGDLDLRRSGPM